MTEGLKVRVEAGGVAELRAARPDSASYPRTRCLRGGRGGTVCPMGTHDKPDPKPDPRTDGQPPPGRPLPPPPDPGKHSKPDPPPDKDDQK